MSKNPVTAYLKFFLASPRILSFGILLTLFSSFGQTFLISLSVPHLLQTFVLDPAGFGLMYGAATVLSGVSLPFFGRLIDRVSLRRFSLCVGVGMVLASLVLATAPNLILLFVGLLGLRLAGQGLLSLTASTTMARAFDDGRGRALSVSSLGYPLGEGLLPLVVAVLISVTDWRMSFGIQAAFIAFFLLPAIIWLTKRDRNFSDRMICTEKSTRPQLPLILFRDWRFYALLPSNLFLPLVLTALFLYQGLLAEDRGWSAQTMATGFAGFAMARLLTSIVIGPLIDRWSAVRLFPFILLPVMAGLVFLSAGHSWLTPFAYLFLAGISQGATGAVMTSLWAEVYGVSSLGKIKGTVASFSIFATALGPLLVGGMIKKGVDFSLLTQAGATAALGIMVLGLAVQSRLVVAQSGKIEKAHGVL